MDEDNYLAVDMFLQKIKNDKLDNHSRSIVEIIPAII